MENVGWREAGYKNPKPAPGSLALVQDFVNTRNYLRGGDLLGDVEGATARLAERGLLEAGERISESDRQRLVEFREGLRDLLLAHNGALGGSSGEEARPVEHLASSVVLRVRFDAHLRPVLEPASEVGTVERILGRLLAEAVRAEAEGRWKRLKACRDEDCMWAFYDASKNGMGRWCDMQICGARHKMRRYRERKAEGG